MKKRVILIGTMIALVGAIATLAIALFLPRNLSPSAAAASSNCAQCHGDHDRLAELSEQPDRYYVDPAQFVQEAHGGLACTRCHTGDSTKTTPEEACLNGKAYKNPAATTLVAQTCGSCHAEITARSLKSIHTSLDGIRLSLIDLMGEKEGTARFQATCNDCHTTCSSCHMEDPDRRNMLWPRVTSHSFQSHSNSKACVACHAGMGDTFFGTTGASKHEPSLMAQAGMQCVDCHGDREVHGTGTKTSFSMESPKPTCDECHRQPTPRVTSAKDTLVAPQYSLQTPAHELHPEEAIACESCHTRWYPSCWNCHDGKVDKSVESLYLAVSPLTHRISPAAHSPAVSGASGPIPTSMGGGWAIKSRHSWGASQTCETCHTEASVYIVGSDRQAPFVGYWTAQRAKATFVDESLAQTLVIDQARLKQSAHKDQTCSDCHTTLTDAVCAECHTKTAKSGKTVLPVEGDWSRASYVAVKANLEQSANLIRTAQAAGTNVADWQREWEGLKASYLQVGKTFHAEPGPARAQANELRAKSETWLQTVRQATQSQLVRNQVLPAGLLSLAGTVGAVALVFAITRRVKR